MKQRSSLLLASTTLLACSLSLFTGCAVPADGGEDEATAETSEELVTIEQCYSQYEADVTDCHNGTNTPRPPITIGV